MESSRKTNSIDVQKDSDFLSFFKCAEREKKGYMKTHRQLNH